MDNPRIELVGVVAVQMLADWKRDFSEEEARERVAAVVLSNLTDDERAFGELRLSFYLAACVQAALKLIDESVDEPN